MHNRTPSPHVGGPWLSLDSVLGTVSQDLLYEPACHPAREIAFLSPFNDLFIFLTRNFLSELLTLAQ